MDSSRELSLHSTRPPRSTKEIAKDAVEFPYDHNIPLSHWLRSSDVLMKEANIYLSEGNEERAYLLLIRFVELLYERLPNHPGARTAHGKDLLSKARQRAPKAIDILEELKPRLNARYEAYQQSHASQRARSSSSSSARSSTSKYMAYPGAASSRGQRPKSGEIPVQLQAGEFSSRSPIPNEGFGDDNVLALERARQEFERRERDKRERRLQKALESGRNVVLDSRGVEIKRVVPQDAPASRELSDGWQQSYAQPARNHYDADDLSKRLQSLSMLQKMTMPSDRRVESGLRDSRLEHQGHWGGSYPTVPKSSHSPIQFNVPSLPPLTPLVPSLPPKDPLPPALPSKIALDIPPSARPYHSPSSSVPVRPPKELLISPQPLHPAKSFSTPASLENGIPLRTVFLPSALRNTFLSIAKSNTVRNLETCGILAGTLLQNALFISRLIIPEQESTSDTCAMTDEESLFSYCSEEDLLVLGWIHTHPTQTCFMSSVDLHTHWGFQWQLKESIAVVCAPRYGDWGVFRLTDPPGFGIVGGCKKQGLFHEHDVPNGQAVYRDALRPGHVVEAGGMEFDVVDLRKS
ncbi:hypothetical protein EX30DRAFT_362308 [Ascodesmis nigricans]|uniref:MPN domain-containing protein n=1 Tax=Ascodesmis nigricans TaxID=341454 RepID=A0A4S2N5F7_9PEZI|nr:hypothetical protein EX30DRAFT_362308 [Ascodesmis nigricans]